VLFVLGTMGVGGTERQVIEILRHLNRERFEPSLYLIYREGELLGQVPQDVPIFSYWDRHAYPRVNYPGRILRSQARDIRHTIQEQDIDEVYDRTSNVTLIASLATRRTRVKRISVAVADPRQEIRANHARFGFAKRYLLGRAYRTADRVVAVSEGVRTGLIEFFRLPPEQVTTCYNVFDVPRLDELAAEPCPDFDESRFHVVSVGRLQREKGQSYLVDAVDELVNRRELSQVLLWLVGNGPDEVLLRNRVAELKLDEHVRFEGFQANPMPYVRHADLFCLPSLFEGMPNALVEAMIAGTPVVSSDCRSGPREILGDGEHGCLVPPADSLALADAIEDAINNRTDWAGRTASARRFVEQTYSVEAGMARIEKLLQEVADGVP
jgi:glycosyltransferase involved in cell wall biosynthesis